MQGESPETIRHESDADSLAVTRLQLLRKSARVLYEAVAGQATHSAPPWTTLASVHAALAALVNGDVLEAVPGRRLLAEELVGACLRLRSGHEQAVHATAGAVARGIDLLVDGTPPVSASDCANLLPVLGVIEELRTLRGGASIAESPCFRLPDFAALQLSRSQPEDAGVPERLAELRIHYQRGLLAWVRDYSDEVGLLEAKRAPEYLARHGLPISTRPAWHCIGVWLDTLLMCVTAPTEEVRRLLGAIANAIHRPGLPAGRGGRVPRSLLRQVLFRLAQARSEGSAPLAALRSSIDLGGVFVSSHVGEATTEIDAIFEQLAAEMDELAAGGVPGPGLGGRITRCLDVLALQGRYGERAALFRQWPGPCMVAVDDTGVGSSHGPAGAVDWSRLALSFRASQSRNAAESASATETVHRTPESPWPLTGQTASRFGEVKGANRTAHSPVSQGPLPQAELERAGDALRELDATIADMQSARSAGLPFADPLPETAAPRRSGVLPEPTGDDVSGASTGGDIDLRSLARRVGAVDGTDVLRVEPQDDVSMLVDTEWPERSDGPHGDGELLENLQSIVRDLGTSRHHTEQQIAVLRDDAMAFDRVLRVLHDDLRRLRSAVEAGPQGKLVASRSASPGEVLSAPVERLSVATAELDRIQRSLEQTYGRVRDRLREQARAEGSLQAGLRRGRTATLGTVWDELVPGLRTAAKARGLELVLALTGAGVVLPSERVAIVSDGLRTVFSGLVEALHWQRSPAGQGPVIADVHACDLGPRLDVTVVLRGAALAGVAHRDSVFLVSLRSLAREAGSQMRIGAHGFSLSFALAPEVMRLIPFKHEECNRFAVPAGNVLEILPADEVRSRMAGDVYLKGDCRAPVIALDLGVESGPPLQPFVTCDSVPRQFLHLTSPEGECFLAVDMVEEPLVISVDPMPKLLINSEYSLGAASTLEGAVLTVLSASALCSRACASYG